LTVAWQVFHPVRDVGTASDGTAISTADSAATQTFDHKRSMTKEDAKYMALCLIRNPRPARPSYNCPFGCPHHEQITCPTVYTTFEQKNNNNNNNKNLKTFWQFFWFFYFRLSFLLFLVLLLWVVVQKRTVHRLSTPLFTHFLTTHSTSPPPLLVVVAR